MQQRPITPNDDAGFAACAIVDWSSSSTRRPPTPRADALWLAQGARDRPFSERTAPTYHRTRASLIAELADWLASIRTRVLVGFDFPFAYPHVLDDAGVPAMPSARALCAFLHQHIRDDDDSGANNRFHVAARCNLGLADRFSGEAPFWGSPASLKLPGLTAQRPVCARIPALRACERFLHARAGPRPQSAWKLAYAGSVGSQTLTGLPRVHQLLTDPRLADRCLLWPFETNWHRAPLPDNAIVIAEVYPSLADHDSGRYLALSSIKDARQVAALRDAILDAPTSAQLALLKPPHNLPEPDARLAMSHEGWIFGAGAAPFR